MDHKIDRENKEQGQALIEFALTVPILLMFMFGIIDLARVIVGLTQTIDATRQAVRYGIVDGLEANSEQYLDCAGIRQAALDTPGVADMSNTRINIYYEDSDGNKLSDCTEGLSAWDVNHGDVLVVEVQGGIEPVTPVLMMFTDQITFSYTSRRSIMAEGSAYTDEWPSSPPAPEGFNATVDCSTATNNVSFTWSAISPTPDRAEIRNSITGEVVVNLDSAQLTQDAYYNGASISNYGGFGMYYMITFVDDGMSGEIAGPSSQDATVSCDSPTDKTSTETSTDTSTEDDVTDVYTDPSTDTDTVSAPEMSISGTVYEDGDLDGIKGVNEKGIAGVTVYIISGGADGVLGTCDDETDIAISDKKGLYTFTGLSIPAGLSGQVYRLTVSTTNPAVTGMAATSSTYIDVSLLPGSSFTGANFGFAGTF